VKYERHKLEAFPPKQKLCMLYNAVGEYSELTYVKQIGDQDIGQGNMVLTYKRYMELLLLVCYTLTRRLYCPVNKMIQWYVVC
jgi:hypothetical protein